MAVRREKKQKAVTDEKRRNYMMSRTALGLILLLVIAASVLTIMVNTRLRLTSDQIYATNRVRIDTVIAGLQAGISENDDLSAEYDAIFTAKLKGANYMYDGFESVDFFNKTAADIASLMGVDAVAIIDSAGKTIGRYNCGYDFTIRRFAMLRACSNEDGTSEPFSIHYPDRTVRFFGMNVAADRILVFAQDWTETEENIQNATSWEAVLRGMVSVDTLSIAVSLKDYSFLYNPVADLTGRDALQNGVPIEALNDGYEGELEFGGETYCVVGRQWGDAMVYVMTRAGTNMANDTVLLVFLAVVFLLFIAILSVYGIIINRDNISTGKRPSYITLKKRTDPKTGEVRNVLNFNLTVAKKLLPITLGGVVAVTALCYYTQSITSLSSIAYESNQAIANIGTKLERNTEDATRLNLQYKEVFLDTCSTLTNILEENPDLLYNFSPEDEKVHYYPFEISENGGESTGLDRYGNPAYVQSEHPFLQELCRINNIAQITIFGEDGRIMATSGTGWWFQISDAPEAQSWDFHEILSDHIDYIAQDLAVDEEGNLSQYIGSAYYYYTYQDPETNETKYASRADYQQQLLEYNTTHQWNGPVIDKVRGVLQINIAPERLRSIAQTATLSYVADHTTIHGTGHTVICDTSDEHRCVYSPREADIGKTAAAMGYSPLAFNETGEMYNGFETLNGVEYFQTFKMVDEQNVFIGTSVPMDTVYSTRDSMTLITFITVLVGFLANFIYTCAFGSSEELMYSEDSGAAPDWRLRNEKDTVTITMPSGKTRKARTAASRWDAEYIPWWSKTPEQKFAQIAGWAFDLFAYMLFLCIVLSRSGVVTIDAINYVYEGVWTKGLNIFALTNGAITLIVVFVIAKLVEMVIDNMSANIGSRAETLGHLISSVIHYGVAIFAVFYALYLCGLDTGSLIASAGILSLVIGLGAQSMIQDILAGVFIVFEGAFRVGDIVTIGDFRGNVLEIGLRTTKIEDPAKNIKIFNNSTLSGIINMTKEASYAGIDVGIAYGEDIRKVEEVLKRELPLMKKRLPAIMDGPFYRGVSELAASSVNIKILALCKEADRIQLCRDLNREMLIILQDNGIDIPFPQVTLSYLEGGDGGNGEKDSREKEAEELESRV